MGEKCCRNRDSTPRPSDYILFLDQDGAPVRGGGDPSRRPDAEAKDEAGGEASKVLRDLREVRRLQEVQHQAQEAKAASGTFLAN